MLTSSARRPARRWLLAALALAGLLLAACGGSAGTPASSPSPTATGVAAREAAAMAFVRCARAHGAPTLRDPTVDAQGNVHLSPPPGLSSDTALVQRITQACSKYIRSIKSTGLTPQSTAQRDSALTQFSACMRSHGLPDYPDPDFASAQPLPKPSNTADPAYQRAFSACQHDLRNAGKG